MAVNHCHSEADQQRTDATVSNLPAGLTATKNATAKTVTISGTPTASGTFTVTRVQTAGKAIVLTGSITVTSVVVIQLKAS